MKVLVRRFVTNLVPPTFDFEKLNLRLTVDTIVLLAQAILCNDERTHIHVSDRYARAMAGPAVKYADLEKMKVDYCYSQKRTV